MVTGPKDLPATIATQDCQHCASLSSPDSALTPPTQRSLLVHRQEGLPSEGVSSAVAVTFTLYPNAEQTIGTHKIYKPKCQKFYLLNFFFYPLSS